VTEAFLTCSLLLWLFFLNAGAIMLYLNKLSNALIAYFFLSLAPFLACANAASLQDLTILTEEYPPYNYLDDKGYLKGIAVDLLVKAYEKAGTALNTADIKIQPWPRSYRQLQRTTNTMLFSTTRNTQREPLFKWAGPISKTKISLIAKKSRNIIINEPKDMEQYKVGGILEDIGLQLVTSLLSSKNNIVAVPTTPSLTGMLNLDRIDLWAYEENAAKLFLKRHGFDTELYESVYTLSEAELFYAFSLKTEQKIVDRLQRAIDEIRAEENTP
jgi:ABC-type amino acid transport substrate-binding protein